MSRPWLVASTVMASVLAAIAPVLLAPPSLALACLSPGKPPPGEGWSSGPDCVWRTPDGRTYEELFPAGMLDHTMETLLAAALVIMFVMCVPVQNWLALSRRAAGVVRFMTPGTPVKRRG
jgi:hypothetical protein